MFFQINITPKAKKTAESVAKAKPCNSYSLLLAPFQPPTRIKLDTNLNSSVECQLTIKNSNNRHLNVSVSKAPPQERLVDLSATEWSIEPDSSVVLTIKWEPKEEGSWRDVLQLSDSRRIKYDIPLILNSINPNKGAKSRGLGKTTKKSISASRPSHASMPTIASSQKLASSNNKQAAAKKTVQSSIKRSRASSNDVFDKENTSHNVGLDWMLNQAKTKKQRKEPSPPKTLDFSKFLDSSTFKFTPLRPKFPRRDSSFTSYQLVKNEDKQEQQQQPIIEVETTVQTTLRKETYITVPKFLKVMPVSPEVKNGNEDEHGFDDSLSPRSADVDDERRDTGISVLLDDIKFTPFKSPKRRIINDIPFSPGFCSTELKSKNGSFDRLDSANKPASKNATFEIVSPDSFEQNNTYDLPKSPTSTRNSSNLKPFCLAKAFDKDSVEVEFSTPLPPRSLSSNLAAAAAAASDHSRYSNQFSKSQIDCGSAKDCLQADLWVKNKNTSLSPMSKSLLHSTLESIREEDNCPIESSVDERNFGLKRAVSDKRPDPLCIEISPPKKFVGQKPAIRKISPNKNGKVLKEKPAAGIQSLKKKIQNDNTSMRNDSFVAKIPGVRISKLSLAKLNNDKDKGAAKKTKKQSKEVSVKLHNPNDFLTMFCNPDPFAATMTQDPFLASSLYYDDRWIFIQELEFKKWLNALLTPPEHLSTDVESNLVDVGKVWQSVRAKEDVTLAETKESISARYHTDMRLNYLRKAACAMFRKGEVIAALSQTVVGIEKEVLLIRPDKDLHRDIGLQKTILELFIGYNPLWLRIGLETIYGETIPLHSNNDIIGLSRFLLQRFFSDPYIVRQHSANGHPNIRLASFQAVMNKFMLKKFLFVVFFLDFAKRNKLIGHDPCLFHKKAQIKDSRSILLTFAREVLSGIGDVTKVLRNYGYAVSHKQTHLDEYDYAVTNLCTDLRDGVRLCRLMELMTGQRSLTCRCRVPAISRLQKVHNVGVALDALRGAGYEIVGDVDAKCIADGHREKTLSLLWQIIYKFQRPRFEKAASTLQRWWRSKLWAVRIRAMLRRIKDDAASTIQRAWRCWQARRKLTTLRRQRAFQLTKRTRAACVLQRHWRLYRERLLVERSAARIQRWWRRVHETRAPRRLLRQKREIVVVIQRRYRATRLARQERQRYLRLIHATVTIQSLWKGKQQRQRYEHTRIATLVVQRAWRARLKRQRDLAILTATIRIQKWWRMRMAEKREQERLAALRMQACMKIQTWWQAMRLGRLQRERYLQLKWAAEFLESRWLALRIGRQEREHYLRLRQSVRKIQRWWRARMTEHMRCEAARMIQSYWRGMRERRRYLLMRSSACKIQTWWRMNHQRQIYQKQRLSVRKIQIWWRIRINERKRREAARMIQSRWRGMRERRRYLLLRSSACKIQSWWRANNQRQIYQKMRRNVCKIQIWWRAQMKERKRREAALMIQSCWRGVRERRRYLLMKSSACKIQSWWRANHQRHIYQQMRRSVYKIQIWWRARMWKRKREEAARLIQTRWRGMRERRRYLLMKNSACKIQSWWRANHQRQIYQRLRLSACKIQSWWRTKARERRRREAARLIQSHWRGLRERRRYMLLRSSACKVQTWWRMNYQHRRYQQVRQSVCKIQVWWRTKARERRQREAARLIQSRWRGALARHRYLQLRSSACKIQNCWRASHQRRHYLRQRLSARKIQNWWRARANKRIEAAIKIQSFWRSVLISRQCHSEFQALKFATIVLQRCYREKLRQRAERRRRAVLLIEEWWLNSSERLQAWKAERARLQRLHEAAVKIQSVWRGFKVRQAASKKLAVLRSRAEQAAKAAVPTATLAFRLQDNIEKFRYASNIGQLSVSLASLDVLVRLLPNACIEVCQLNLVSRLYDILTQANRSLPWLDVCLKDVSILLTLAKFKPTSEHVVKIEYVEVLARLLTISSDKKEELFLHTATLVWVLTENNEYAEAAKNCPRTKYLLQSLYTSINKKLAHKSMSNISHRFNEDPLPSPNPDWGLRNRRPRTFSSVAQAVIALASRLNILSIAQSIDMQKSFNFTM